MYESLWDARPGQREEKVEEAEDVKIGLWQYECLSFEGPEDVQRIGPRQWW